MSTSVHDVVVCGGGLAGLTLALQIRREIPAATVAVVEPTRRPLPEACHKVGESSVELASHYLAEVLGLADYLDRNHLYKNGLRFFLGDAQGPLSARTEVGPPGFPPVPSFQLDRGRLENDLRSMVQDRGVDLMEGWAVESLVLGVDSRPHRVVARNGTDTRELTARWLVDATGRRRLLQRQLGLGRPSPIEASSAWFRVRGRVNVSELVPGEQSAWHNRDLDGERWLSTNHLCGTGYWVWLIPLSSGHTSIGIVVSNRHHDFEQLHTGNKALAWIARHEPRLAERLHGVGLEDFRCLRNYAHLSREIFSANRWSCVGEAGLFVDPLYSPGSDLIALANTFTTRLIQQDLAGSLDPEWVHEFNELYMGWADDTGNMLRDHGDTLGQPAVFSAKVWFDFFHYWAFICQYFIQGLHGLPLAEHREIHKLGRRYFDVNQRAQLVLRAWAAANHGTAGRPHVPMPQVQSMLAQRHAELGVRKTLTQTRESMESALEHTEEILREIVLRAVGSLASQDIAAFARVAQLGSWKCRIPATRIQLEGERGPTRRRQLGRVARDMERALGRVPVEPAELQQRLLRAGVLVA